MIITQLVGGLGNQMFQYAFGRALALRHRVPLRMDTHAFRYYRLRQFELREAFSPAAEQASGADRRALLGWRGLLPALAALRSPAFERWRGARLLVQDVRQPAARYLAAASASCYLAGYWQSELFFADAAPQVRADFRFRAPLSGASRDWARRIEECTAVSVHVRRGDYVSNPKTRALHGVCSPEYYARAMAHLAERAPGARFFIFSDDLAWARASLEIRHAHHFVEGQGAHAHLDDLRLISLCRHHIIANSSFSWWGAWLSEHADKIVVAPARWVLYAELPEVVPPSWVRL